MVEMVFVLPLLLLLVFAIAQFGLMFSRWLTLSNAVREGAREAVVFRSPCNSGQVENAVRNRVVQYANAGGVPIGNGDVDVTGACAGEGTDAIVQADFDFSLHVPFAPSLGDSTSGCAIPCIRLDYTSTMRNE